MNSQILNKCIWCLRTIPQVKFTSDSHVLPKCVGNLDKQVLPKGIVCDKCNNFFSHSVEPALIADPTFHVLAVILKIRHPDKGSFFRCRIFDDEHKSATGEHQEIHIENSVSSKKLRMMIDYRTQGEIIRTYDLAELALLSRAIYKIAFESYVWHKVVNKDSLPFDILDENFKNVRNWVRYGEPQKYVRPVLRLRQFSSAKGEWVTYIWGFQNSIMVEVDLFGDWYATDLVSQNERALDTLREWAKKNRPSYPTWVLKEDLGV